MKNALKFGLLGLAVSTLSLVACKKDEKTGKDYLTDAKTGWKLSKSEVDNGSGGWTVETIDACTADDVTIYKTDGNYSFDEGASKCDPTDPQTATGTYTLSADEKTLTQMVSGIPLPFTVVELTASKVVLEIDFLGKSRSTLVPK